MNDSPDLVRPRQAGLRVLVTAGASGIGRAIADLLIARRRACPHLRRLGRVPR